jgi:transcriptional regulator with XRE-family HTH domain
MRRYTNLRLAREIHYSVQRVSRVLNGYDKASQTFMDACSKALDLPIDELFRTGGRNGY